MFVVVLLLALLMMAGGAAATFRGADLLLSDRGLPMVIAGVTVVAAGFVLIGLAAVVRGLGRIERQLARIDAGFGDARAANLLSTARPPRDAEGAAATRATSAASDDDTRHDAFQDVAAPVERAPAPASSPADEGVVVGRYQSGGNTYTMYANGSIVADTPTGQRRFASLDELKAFVSAGGEAR